MISRDDIRGLAQLVRLKLSPQEEEDLGKDISNILGYVAQVGNVAQSATDEAPLLHNVMREDREVPVLGKREDLIAQFPKREGDFDVVRKIIEKDE